MNIEPNAASMTPPTDQADLEAAPSKWPTVIGVIGVVLASMGLLCGCAGFFMVPLQRWGAEMQAQSGHPDALADAQVKVGELFQIPQMVLVALGMILTIWLLVGSIGLLRRRRTARNQLMIWAMCSILLFALNIALQVIMFQAMTDELSRAGESQRIDELWIGVIFGGCIGLLFGLSLQAFVLIWFSRKKIKSEMEQWR